MQARSSPASTNGSPAARWPAVAQRATAGSSGPTSGSRTSPTTAAALLEQLGAAPDVDRTEAVDPPRFLGPGDRVGDATIAAALTRYDAEILAADRAVRAIIDSAVAAEPVGEAPLVIIVSDHGEALGERQASHRVAFGHGALLYEEVVRVPWIVAWPGRLRPAVIDTPVSLVDLAATVMDLVDPGAGFETEGRSLVASVREGVEPAPAPIYVERRLFSSYPLDYLRGTEIALVDGPWKLIVNDGRRSPELYDLAADPGERRDLAGEHPQRASAMRRRVEGWRRERPLGRAARTVPVNRRAGELRALRALGYID